MSRSNPRQLRPGVPAAQVVGVQWERPGAISPGRCGPVLRFPRFRPARLAFCPDGGYPCVPFGTVDSAVPAIRAEVVLSIWQRLPVLLRDTAESVGNGSSGSHFSGQSMLLRPVPRQNSKRRQDGRGSSLADRGSYVSRNDPL